MFFQNYVTIVDFIDAMVDGQVSDSMVKEAAGIYDAAYIINAFSPDFDASFDHGSRGWIGPDAARMTAYCALADSINQAVFAQQKAQALAGSRAKNMAIVAPLVSCAVNSVGSTGEAWHDEIG